MKRFIVNLLVLVVSISLLLAACSSSTPAPASSSSTAQTSKPIPASSISPEQASTSSPTTTSTQKFNISYANYWPEPSEEYKQVYKPILDEITKNSNGRITFTTYLGGALGGGAEIYDEVVTNKVDMGSTGTSYYPGRFPLEDIYALPGAFGGDLKYADVANALFKDILYKDYPDTHALAIEQSEPFHFYTAKKQIKVMEDLKGLKFRTANSMTSKAIQALGGIPVEMPLGDVYLSLQTGVVDGAVCGPSAIPGFKLNEVLNYEVTLSVTTGVNMITFNKDDWAKLPPDLQQIITTAAQNVALNELQEYARDNPKVVDMLKAKGGAVYTLPPDEQQRWIDTLKPLVTQWESDMKAKGLPVEELLTFARQECAKRNLPFPY